MLIKAGNGVVFCKNDLTCVQTHRGGGAPPVFDPGTLNLSVWFRGSYTASPWEGEASAGDSGTRDAAEATNPPSSGTAVNTYNPADFDGTNDVLANATAVGTLVPAAGYFWWALFMVDAVGTDFAVPDAFANQAIWADGGGYIGCALRSTGPAVMAWQYDGIGKGAQHTISTGTWNLLCCRYDGTNIKSKLNSGALSSNASGAYDITTGQLMLGRNWAGAQFFNGKLLELGMSPEANSDDTMDDVKSYVNSRYNLSL